MKEDEFPEVKDIIDRNTYVDDIVYSCDNMDKAKQLMCNMNLVVHEGGFKIKHWIMSGSVTTDEGLRLFSADEEKILGLTWNPS